MPHFHAHTVDCCVIFLTIIHQLMPSSPFFPPNDGARWLQSVPLVHRMARVGGIYCYVVVVNSKVVMRRGGGGCCPRMMQPELGHKAAVQLVRWPPPGHPSSDMHWSGRRDHRLGMVGLDSDGNAPSPCGAEVDGGGCQRRRVAWLDVALSDASDERQEDTNPFFS